MDRVVRQAIRGGIDLGREAFAMSQRCDGAHQQHRSAGYGPDMRPLSWRAGSAITFALLGMP
jgi:hypothetical protein